MSCVCLNMRKCIVFVFSICIIPTSVCSVPVKDLVIRKLLDQAALCPDKLPIKSFFDKFHITSFDCVDKGHFIEGMCKTLESWRLCTNEENDGDISIYANQIEKRMETETAAKRVEVICDFLVKTCKTNATHCSTICDNNQNPQIYQFCNFYEALYYTIQEAFVEDVGDDITMMEVYFRHIPSLLPTIHGLILETKGILAPCLDDKAPYDKPCNALKDVVLKMIQEHKQFIDIGRMKQQNITAVCSELRSFVNNTADLSSNCSECNLGDGEAICQVAALGMKYLNDQHDACQPSQKSPAKVTDEAIQLDEGSSGHFVVYFLLGIVFAVGGYVLFHYRHKVIALVWNGDKKGGNVHAHSRQQYKKLKTEDEMQSLEKTE